MKPCFIYVPAEFDAQSVLPPSLQQYADCARYVLHRIIWGYVQRQTTSDGFVCLKWDYLRTVIPDRALQPIINALIVREVIDRDRFYVEGVKSYGYRLNESFASSDIIRVALTDSQTTDKIRGNRHAAYKKIRLDVHRFLRRKYFELDIDADSALSLLRQHNQFQVVKIPVEQISTKSFEFSVCRFGRVHTDLTRLPKVARNALHVRGKSLVELDIANSQPLFLGLLIINFRQNGNKVCSLTTFPENRSNPYKDIDSIIQRTVTPIDFTSNPTTSTLLLPSNTTCNASVESPQVPWPQAFRPDSDCPQSSEVINDLLSPDELSYLCLCQQGRLYEEFLDRPSITSIRSWVKEEFFSYIFGANSFKSALKSEFQETFPNVAEVIRIHKRKDYRFLSRLMQLVESNFIINTVCRRIMSELEQAPVLTIHDCLLTTSEWAKPFEQIIREEFRKLGLSPSIHISDRQ